VASEFGIASPEDGILGRIRAQANARENAHDARQYANQQTQDETDQQETDEERVVGLAGPTTAGSTEPTGLGTASGVAPSAPVEAGPSEPGGWLDWLLGG
jgi:hypothetical protein